MCSLSLQHFIFMFDMSGVATPLAELTHLPQNHIPDPNKEWRKVAFLTAFGFCFDPKSLIPMHPSALKQRCRIHLDLSCVF